MRKKSLGAGAGGNANSANSSGAGNNDDSQQQDGSKSTIKTVFGGLADFFTNPRNKMEISTPYDPVHLTHVGFNVDTGEFTGLPREWQQLLQDSGISKQEQLAHPQAVVDIVKFYQDATKKEGLKAGAEDDDVWEKFGGTSTSANAGANRAAPGEENEGLSAGSGYGGYQQQQPLGYAAHLTQPVCGRAGE